MTSIEQTREVPTEQDRQRLDIAICSRLLVGAEVLNYSGHISARISGTESFLVQTVDDPRATLRPERLLVVGFDGRPIAGSGRTPEEVSLHAELYRARPEVGAVAHFHHDPTTVFSVVDGVPIVPVKNHATRWADGVPVHPDPSHIDSPAKGAEMVRTMGSAHALLLRAHGAVLVAEDVRTLYADVIHFVENAQVLTEALRLGQPVPLTEQEQRDFLRTFGRDRHAAKLWRYYTEIGVGSGLIPPEWLS